MKLRMPDELNHAPFYIGSNSFCVVILKILIASFAVAAVAEEVIIKHNGTEVIKSLGVGVPKGANVTFSCEANESVYWIDVLEKFPLLWTVTFAWDKDISYVYMSAAKFLDGKYKLHPEYNENGTYIAKLDLFDVDHRSVGRYYCIEHSAFISDPKDLLPKTKNNSIQLFVDDDKKHVYEIEHRTIWVWDNCPKFYPCKPTSTKSFTLRQNDTERLKKKEYHEVGYHLQSAQLARYNKFECLSLEGNHSEMYEVHVQIEPSPSTICDGEAMITSKTHDFGVEDVDLEMNCSSKCADIRWELPNNNIAKTENRARIISNGKNTKLIVTNVTSTKDLGEYRCVAKCRSDKYTATLNVTTFLNSSFFNITASSQFSHLESSTNELAEFYLVKYMGYPDPILEWFDDDNKRIHWTFKEDKNEKFEAFRDLNRKWTALKIRNATIADSGNYTLSVRSGLTKTTKTFKLFIKGKPQIKIEEDGTDGEKVTVKCHVYGYPASNIEWSVSDKNGTYKLIDELDVKTFNTTPLNQISILHLNVDNSMAIKCYAKNTEGDTTSANLIIHPDESSNTPMIAVVSSFTLVFLIIFAFLVAKVYLSHKRRKRNQIFSSEIELPPECFEEFLEGDPDSINPDLTLDDQIGLLPYNGNKYEFPRERLKFGKHIGSGAFGMVTKAIAHGIVPNEKETTVAVKTVKQTMDSQGMRALMSELKILVHLGKHLNVVNLLGAVTKNVSQTGEFMVIVEFCEFGNLEHFLKHNRQYFIDEIVRTNDAYIIVPREMMQTQSNSSGYVSVDGSFVPEGDQQQEIINSSYKSEPDARNYSSAETAIVCRSTTEAQSNCRTFTTTDLIRWSLQVAQGMMYLSSRNVLHGDLAARNILLCSENIVKICDFGLARSVYKRDNYHKQTETPLPYKWMAPESIRDNVFSTYSDVWSFGVVMWEVFSLGKVPYAGMDPHELYNELSNDYRMDKPDYATPEVYNIMLSCWEPHPRMRPLFDMLEENISRLLENKDIEHYIRLNEPYMERNRSDFASYGIDYLKQVASPCYVPLPGPSQNERNISEILQSIQQNEQNVSQSINIVARTSITPDLLLQSPSIMTNYLSLNEISKVQNKPAENRIDEIEMCEQNTTLPHGAYMRMSSIIPSIGNDNYINSSPISV